MQIFTEEQAEHFSFDVLDATKIVPEELVPLQPVGRMVLNRNPDNFFAETEQVAFCTAHVVPGIDFTTIRCWPGASILTWTRRSRVSAGPTSTRFRSMRLWPRSHNNQRDGFHRQAITRGRVAYEPNSLAAAALPGGDARLHVFPQNPWRVTRCVASRRNLRITTTRRRFL